MICPSCRSRQDDSARFCVACGTQLPVAATGSPDQQRRCSGCGAVLLPGRRFCTACGIPAQHAPLAPTQVAPSPVAASPSYSPFSIASSGVGSPAVTAAAPANLPRTLLALAGLAVAAAGTFLPWVSVEALSLNGWEAGRFRLAAWLGTSAHIDALAILALCALGAVLLVSDSRGGTTATLRWLTVLAGAGATAIGALQIWYLLDSGADVSRTGIGLYTVMAGGILAAVCSLSA